MNGYCTLIPNQEEINLIPEVTLPDWRLLNTCPTAKILYLFGSV